MSKACLIEGCGKPGTKRGWCVKHYYRWRMHGDPLGGRTPNGAGMDFIEQAIKSDTGACILWPYGKSQGYGVIYINGKTRYVHRLVCVAANGEPPTPQHEAAHCCGNRGCITPRHIRWATRLENEADKLQHGTAQRFIFSKLTDAQVIEIRRLRGIITGRALAKRYGVTPSAISRVMVGKARRGVGDAR